MGNLDGETDADDGNDQFTILGMSWWETILAVVLIVFIVDIVFNGGSLTASIVR